jgi:hypothetical protein
MPAVLEPLAERRDRQKASRFVRTLHFRRVKQKRINRSEYAGIVKKVSRKLYAWMKAVDDPILKGAVQSPYYKQSVKDFKKTAK